MFIRGNNPLGGGGEKASVSVKHYKNEKKTGAMQQIYRKHENDWESQSVGNIRSISVVPGQYRNSWADNWFRAALNLEHPGDCREGRIRPRVCPILL